MTKPAELAAHDVPTPVTSSAVVPRNASDVTTPLSPDVIQAAFEAADERRRYTGIPLFIATLALLAAYWAARGGYINLPAFMTSALKITYFGAIIVSAWRTHNGPVKELRALGVDKREARHVGKILRDMPFREAMRLRAPEEKAEYIWRRLR